SACLQRRWPKGRARQKVFIRWRSRMSDHSQFEQLSALAAIGQLSPAEQDELEGHQRECPACRNLQADFAEINSLWLSQAQRSRAERDVENALDGADACRQVLQQLRIT